MTVEELQQENEKLNARLQKAVKVFNEQKETIKRLTEERDAAVSKTKDAEEQDNQFFAQEEKIEELTNENITLNERITKASEAYKQQKEQLDKVNKDLNEKNNELDMLSVKLKDTELRLNETLKEKQWISNQLASIKNICEETYV